MIVEFNENGQIYHIISDPVSPEVIQNVILNNPDRHLIVNPLRGPDLQIRNADGEIVFDENGSPIMGPGNLIYQSYEIEDWYVSDGQMVTRPVIEVPSSVELKVGESMTIANLPNPCRIKVDGETITVEGGELELEGDMPAEYQIVIDHFPYKSATLKVTVYEA